MSKKLKRTNLFAKDVSSLLYAYGDVSQPLPETVQCLDELVSGYLVDLCSSAYRTARNSQRNKLKLEDFRFAVRHDAIKLGRADELIATNKLITEAKKQFNGSDNSSLKRFRSGDGNDLEGEDEDEDEYDEEIEEDVGGDEHDKHPDSELSKPKGQYTDLEQVPESNHAKSERTHKVGPKGKPGPKGGKTKNKKHKKASNGTQ